MFGRAPITLGIGPHSSYYLLRCSIAMIVPVCLYVCLYVFRLHISKTTLPNFMQFSVHVNYGCSSVLF